MEVKPYPRNGKPPVCSNCGDKFEHFEGKERKDMFAKLIIRYKSHTVCRPCLRSLRSELKDLII